jgi:hypothetical protein
MVVAVGVGPAKRASWHVVDAAFEVGEVGFAVEGEVGALGEEAAEQAVEVLVDGPLPGLSGQSKIGSPAGPDNPP